MADHSSADPVVDMAGKIREAMVECLEERFGRYYATEKGCERLRDILKGHGIKATVKVGADGRFEIGPVLTANRHTCHWPRCDKQVPPAMWGCKAHWFQLPKDLRDLIWDTYRPGQEVTKNPSPAYVAAAQKVQQWIADYEGHAV